MIKIRIAMHRDCYITNASLSCPRLLQSASSCVTLKNMSEYQKVVVIQDLSREASLKGIRGAMKSLPLEPGDEIVFLGILHQAKNRSMLSPPFTSQKWRLRYKMKADDANPLIVEEEFARKTEEYHCNVHNTGIVRHWKNIQIRVEVKVLYGKKVALAAVKDLGATWVILDRQMKRDKKYFIEELPKCRLSRLKRDNTIKELQGIKLGEDAAIESGVSRNVTYGEMIPGAPDKSPERTTSSEERNTPRNVSYGEMVPGISEDSLDSKKISNLAHFQVSESVKTTEVKSDIELSGSGSTGGQLLQFPGLYQTKDVFKNSVCSCGNRRPIISWSKEFTYAELNKATEGFAPKNFLSEDEFGSVYRGRLNNGIRVAVKQHKHARLQGEKDFKSEVNVLSKARNENLVMLLGSCTEGTNKLLVYEYVCNGSLDQHLSKHSLRPFSWEKRIKVASGAARGLMYLHENNIIHRDMRPNNILVTHDHEPLLGDFGLARAHDDDSDHSLEARAVGTLGYLAPEYAESRKVSTKTDVYAFGVVLLQLITGYTPNDKQLKGRNLVGWARPLLKEGNYPLLLDERIAEYYDVHYLYWMVRVAEKCLSKNPLKRPTMAIVVQILDYLANGDPTSSVRALSPAHSDTFSVAESNVSTEDTEAEKGSAFSSFGHQLAAGVNLLENSPHCPGMTNPKDVRVCSP